jgi:hypothetical protein
MMTLSALPFWAWVPLLMTSTLFLFMCLAPLVWEWYLKDEIRFKARPALIPCRTTQVWGSMDEAARQRREEEAVTKSSSFL